MGIGGVLVMVLWLEVSNFVIGLGNSVKFVMLGNGVLVIIECVVILFCILFLFCLYDYLYILCCVFFEVFF